MFHSHKSKHFFKLAVPTCLLMLTACYAPEYHASNFHPEQVSCTDKSSPEDRAEIDTVLHNPDGDLYWIAHYQKVIRLLKTAADKGNVHSMLLFGESQYEMIFAKNAQGTHGPNGFIKGIQFPEKSKEDIVESLTYIHLAAAFEGEYKNQATKLVQHAEENTTLRIPIAWIQEAKANAQQWKEYCRQ